MECFRSDFEEFNVNQPAEPNKNPEDFNSDLDLLPEYCHYQDDGCELAISCLKCPFPRCIHDHPLGRTKSIRKIRDAQILRLHTWKKMTIGELAVTFRLSERSIARILARGKNRKETTRHKRENLK
jgi:hypothetical protein